MKVTEISWLEFGTNCVQILQYKMAKDGISLESEKFSATIERNANRLKKNPAEVRQFFEKFLLPHVLTGRGFSVSTFTPIPTYEEAEMGYRLLKIMYFWNLDGLDKHVKNISAATRLSLERVQGITKYIVGLHLRDLFGDESDLTMTQ